jgi:hypothetical protein
MDSLLRNETARRVAATLGVVGSIALGYQYILVPLLTVPSPAKYGFYAAWLVLVGLSIAWWRRHPWRSFGTPIVGFIAAAAVLWFGGEYLGWAA